RIFIDVNVIIKIDEIVSQRLAEYSPGDCHQNKADEEIGDPWLRPSVANTRGQDRDTGRMLSAVRTLPLFHDARAKATSCHLLCLDHAAVCRIGKEQYCFPVRRLKASCPG